MASVVDLPFTNTNIYINLLPNSVFKNSFNHFHSMFQ